MDVNHILGYTGAVITGLVLGLMGGGGALLSIPVLVYLFHLEAPVATGYSLFLVGIAASFGAVQNIRKKLVDYHAALYYGIPSVITVYLVRRFLIPALPDVIFSSGDFVLSKSRMILLLLSVVMFGVALNMILSKDAESEEKQKHALHHIILIFYAILIGGFLGLVGAGGGFLIIPALIYFADLPMKKAIGTSLLLVAVNSFIGFTGDIHSNQNMDWSFLFIFSAFSVSGVMSGHYIGRLIDNHKLRKLFGWFILLTGIYIVFKETILN